MPAIYSPGDEPPAKERIDATGKAVLPGLIDMHSHHRQGAQQGGFEYKDTIYTSTLQCAAGGVTTSVGMPNVTPPPNTLEKLEAQFAIYRSDAVVDWNFNPAPTAFDEIPKMARPASPPSRSSWSSTPGASYPHMPGIGIHDHGKLLEIMKACAAVNVPLMVHPHDQALMDVIEKEYWARGERDALAYARAYAAGDGVIWETAIGVLLRLQRASGVHLHLLHTQTAGSVDLIRRAKDAGQNVTCEINPWALFLGCDWAAIERLGSYALSYWVPEKNVPEPVGRAERRHDRHRRHRPCAASKEEKEIGWKDGWKAHTGTPSTQFYLSLLLNAAREGKIPLERVVDATSTRPARLFGLQEQGRNQTRLRRRPRDRRPRTEVRNRGQGRAVADRLDAVRRPQRPRPCRPDDRARSDGVCRRQGRRRERLGKDGGGHDPGTVESRLRTSRARSAALAGE